MNAQAKIPVTKTIIPALRAAGIRISINHSRAFDDGENVYIRQYPRRVNRTGFPILPWGGETTVNLIFPDGQSYTGVATCSLEDRFDRKVGISIALHRALDTRKRFKHVKGSPIALTITGSRITATDSLSPIYDNS